MKKTGVSGTLYSDKGNNCLFMLKIPEKRSNYFWKSHSNLRESML